MDHDKLMEEREDLETEVTLNLFEIDFCFIRS